MMEDSPHGHFILVIAGKRLFQRCLLGSAFDMQNQQVGFGNDGKGQGQTFFASTLGMDRQHKRPCFRVDRLIKPVGTGKKEAV